MIMVGTMDTESKQKNTDASIVVLSEELAKQGRHVFYARPWHLKAWTRRDKPNLSDVRSEKQRRQGCPEWAAAQAPQDCS
jgi:hypothetical protein